MPVLQALADIKQIMEDDPEALAASPYDEETKELLSELLKPKIVEKTVEKVIREGSGRGRPSKETSLSDEDLTKVREGIKKEIENLDDLDAGDGLDTNERVQIAKTRTTLRDQLLKMQERVTNITQTNQFMEVVIGIAEDLIDESGREEMMRRIDAYR